MKIPISAFLSTLLISQIALAVNIHDTETLEAFVDGVIQTSMEEHHVAGVVVSITTPDKVLVSKGYGFADLDKQIRVDPEKTLFRIGSVSKLFIWLPLMQLMEQGKLDLHTDINQYLTSLKIPQTFKKPITIANLMTHTPGFEDNLIALFSKDAGAVRPLADLLVDDVPLRVRPPGEYAGYSNHGAAIAALIVEEISRQSWSDYVTENILSPLGMDSTSLEQPPSGELHDRMSLGYSFESGRFQARDFEIVPMAPVGGISSTAKDMTRYLRMFLNSGMVDGTRIIDESTSQQMQSSLFRPTPELNGTMHGLYEISSHGQTIIGHGGDTLWFHSEFVILPKAGIGFYISTNSVNGPKVRKAFRQALLNRYFPASQGMPESFANTDLSLLAGDYSSIRYSHSDLTKISKIATPVNVMPGENGELVLSGTVLGEYPQYFRETSPLIFKRTGYEDTISFELDASGTASHLYFNEFPIIAFERMSGVESVALNLFLVFLSLILFGWILVVWTAQHFLRKTVVEAPVARFRLVAWLVALSAYLQLFGLASNISSASDIVFGVSGATKIVLSISYLIFLLTLGTIWRSVAVMLNTNTTTIEKTGYAMVLASTVSFSWLLFYWRMFTW